MFVGLLAVAQISTHAPRTGSDKLRGNVTTNLKQFQPTLPARGATIVDLARTPWEGISTHAPRTGSDLRV